MRRKLMLFALVVMAIGAFAPAAAWAEKVDMATYSCQDMLNEKGDDLVLLLFWLDGYYSAKTEDMVIDSDNLASLAGKLKEYCQENLDSRIMTAVEYVSKKQSE